MTSFTFCVWWCFMIFSSPTPLSFHWEESESKRKSFALCENITSASLSHDFTFTASDSVTIIGSEDMTWVISPTSVWVLSSFFLLSHHNLGHIQCYWRWSQTPTICGSSLLSWPSVRDESGQASIWGLPQASKCAYLVVIPGELDSFDLGCGQTTNSCLLHLHERTISVIM